MIDEAIDSELESRLRAAFAEMLPKLLETSTEMVREFDDVPNVVAVHRPHIERRSPRAFVATGLIVAATIVGLIAVAHRDTEQIVPTDPSTVTGNNTSIPQGTTSVEPEWYRLLRPYIPERFEYAALVARGPDQIRVIAIDPTDGKALEMFVSRGIDYANVQPNSTTDEVGKWAELDGLGWNVVTPEGLDVEMTCEIGLPARGYSGRNYCEVEGVLPFTMDEIRAAVATMVASIDVSILEADLGSPLDDVAFDWGLLTEQVNNAVPDPNLMLTRDMNIGKGDRIFEFGTDEARPDMAVRVLRGLYPLPPTTGQAAYALYDDAAAFWMVRADGVAVRLTTTDPSVESLGWLEELGHQLLDGSILDPAPGFTLPETSEPPAPQTTILVSNPTTTLLPMSTGPRLLPTVMPSGFDDIADGYTTDTEGAQADATRVRAFFGTGDRPAVVWMFSTPPADVGQDVDVGLYDMTTNAARPSFGLGVVRPSGRYDWFRSGGLTAEDLQLLADYISDDPTTDTNGDASTDVFTEVTWTHTPQNAHGITWNGPDGQSINMFVESGRGIDALNNGISWSIDVLDTPIGRVFASVDATDASFVQVGLVIDGQVINIEASNVAVDYVVAMAASIVPASDGDWNRRIVG